MAIPKVVVDIEELPGNARESLARLINERRAPLAKGAGGGHVLSLIAGILLLLYLLFAGFGDPFDPARDPVSIAWYVIAIGLVAYAVVSFRRRGTLRKQLGFAPGIYSVGSRMVDARTRTLGVYDLLDQKPSIVHRYVNGGYRQSTLTWHGFVFTFGRQNQPGAALEMIGETFKTLGDAAERNDIGTLLMLDPVTIGLSVHETEKQAAFARGDRRPSAAKSSGRAMLVAAVVTAVLAPGTWWLRNRASLSTAFDRITSSYEVDAWIAAGGDREQGEHKKMQLELQEVVREHANEADKLRAMIEKYKDAPADLLKPVKDALHARYESARKDALGLSASQQLTWFINQVYDGLEKGGSKPAMVVKVARTDSSALAKLDEIVARSKKLSKLIVPVAKYFGPDDEQTREQDLKKAIVAGMGKFFPTDVMAFDQDEAKDAPVIEIYYVIRPQFDDEGIPALYSHIDDAGKPIPGSLQYPGVEFELGATLNVPGGPAPQKVTFTAQPAPTISVDSALPSIPGEDPATASDNAAVYHAMSDSAFSDLQTKLVVALGGKQATATKTAGEAGAGDDGASGGDDSASDLDSDPACAAFKKDLASLETCKTLKASERTKVLDGIKAIGADNTLSATELCEKASALVHSATEHAGCK